MILDLSGGSPLNFKINSCNTEEALLATTTVVNTIGIVTDTSIVSWIFSSTEPNNPEEGVLWIKYGLASAASFNALKRNSILVYPVACWQYEKGAFVQKNGYLMTADGWVQFGSVREYLIKDGVIDLTSHPYSGGEDAVNGSYNGAPAVCLNVDNGYLTTNTFSNVTVPEWATTFIIEYYRLASYEYDPVFTLGAVTVSVDRGGEKYILDGQVSMDVSGIVGMTCDFISKFTGSSGNVVSALKNAWFE